MTSGTAHTLYNLGYQTVDLVLSADGIYVDNRPMNQTKLVVHKGLNNQLNFHVRNRDRVKQNLSTKTLYATVINPNTSKRVIFKPLTLVGGGTTGEARLDLNLGDIQDLIPGLYQIAISESADSGATQTPLYANQNDRIVTDLEVKSSASEKLKKQAGTFSDLSFEYGITVDKRNRAYAPTDGYVSSFNQAVPLYADSPYIRNSYSFSKYNQFTEDAIGTFKIFATAINGLDDKEIRLSKRAGLSTNKLRGFKAGQIGPKDGKDYVGGNYAMSSNLELSLPNFLPESTKTDVGMFLDFGNVWHVDYDSSVGDSSKIRSTAGVNTSWLSPVGPMTFIFSRNLSKAETDVTESFNFKLGTSF